MRNERAMDALNSRERLLRALSFQSVDYVPCCFMSFSALRQRYQGNRYEVVKAQREMGLDPMLFIPTAPRSVRPEHPDLRGDCQFSFPMTSSSRSAANASKAGAICFIRLTTRLGVPYPRLSRSLRIGLTVIIFPLWMITRFREPSSLLSQKRVTWTSWRTFCGLPLKLTSLISGVKPRELVPSPRPIVCCWSVGGAWVWTWQTGCVVCRI